MSSKIPFSEEELKVRFVSPGILGRIDTPFFNSPITASENLKRAVMEKDPMFMPDYRCYKTFTPRIIPDCEARGFVMDGGDSPKHPDGFKDMFGVTWKYIDVAGGSMVEPGKPTIEDMNDWEEILTWPDVDSWDWEGQAALSKDFVNNSEMALLPTIMTGYFERLISLMDFEGAAMALIDEDQQDAIHAFFDKLADTYCKIIDKLVEYFPVAGICIHDDWGSQRSPFFSLDTVREMLVPHMKKVSDHIHSKGLFYDMHCCGHVEQLIPAMIDIGVDTWSGQVMNDKPKLYHLYGDKIMIGVETPPVYKSMSKEEIEKLAKAYVDEFVQPGAVALIGKNSPLEDAYFLECTYRYSRIKLAE